MFDLNVQCGLERFTSVLCSPLLASGSKLEADYSATSHHPSLAVVSVPCWTIPVVIEDFILS